MHIRNFSIIAHIDHGKSTLADRLLESTHTIAKRDMREQVMDQMDLERERGITIKAKTIRMLYRAKDGKQYILNLIDTPGHVDFTYEVSRALAACEGAILVVDSSQGLEAQTLANTHLAQQLSLCLIPVLNKIDLPQADIEGNSQQLKQFLKLDTPPILASAKDGRGTEEILEAIVAKVPPPKRDTEAPLAALIFDSFYDPYRGVIITLRVFEGTLRQNMKIQFFSTQHKTEAEEVGYLTPLRVKTDALSAGEVGYLITGIKDIHHIRVGDTIAEQARPLKNALPGYKEAKPVVFAGFFPTSPSDYENFKNAIEKLHLSDSSFQFQVESSSALGFGYRLGFLGLLHMEIVKERLEREFGLDLIATTPNVEYEAKTIKSKDWFHLDNPADFPESGELHEVREPYVLATIVTPVQFMEAVLNLLKDRRGEYRSIEHIPGNRVITQYELPLSEIVLDFYDKLKSVSKGYASFDYEPSGFKAADVVKLEILIHGDPVDALSLITFRGKAYQKGRALAEKLKELIPRQMFEVAIQARVQGKVIARETIPAIRKDVIAKCYGGDITRKRKLLEKQKEGKKKMKQIGRVEIPQSAFLAALKITE
ncbi:MAG: elongation factor 4 [Elusimicrobia bacterium]|nr:elongation factor 4 [Elusimicrobiota bacterium]